MTDMDMITREDTAMWRNLYYNYYLAMKKYLLTFTCLLFFSCIFLNAQQNDLYVDSTKWSVTSTTPCGLLEEMNFECIAVDGLLSLSETFTFDWEPYTSSPCSVIQSDDMQFLSAIEINLTPKTIQLPKERRKDIYFQTIRDQFFSTGKIGNENSKDQFTVDDLKNNIIFLPTDYAQDVFNADLVVNYSLPLVKAGSLNYYGKNAKIDYTHSEVFIIHKNDIGPVFFYCFYSDEGYKNRRKYLDQLEKAVGFKKE
jgi:hypothetical protein